MNELLAAHGHTSNNRAELENSRLCGCCSCTEIFATDEIVAWTGLDTSSFDSAEEVNAETAVCPRCGAEALIGERSGFPITTDFLSRMNLAWFQTTILRKPGPSK
jgi:hypothetical protein